MICSTVAVGGGGGSYVHSPITIGGREKGPLFYISWHSPHVMENVIPLWNVNKEASVPCCVLDPPCLVEASSPRWIWLRMP